MTFIVRFIVNFCIYYKWIPLFLALLLIFLNIFQSPSYSVEYRSALVFITYDILRETLQCLLRSLSFSMIFIISYYSFPIRSFLIRSFSVTAYYVKQEDPSEKIIRSLVSTNHDNFASRRHSLPSCRLLLDGQFSFFVSFECKLFYHRSLSFAFRTGVLSDLFSNNILFSRKKVYVMGLSAVIFSANFPGIIIFGGDSPNKSLILQVGNKRICDQYVDNLCAARNQIMSE